MDETKLMPKTTEGEVVECEMSNEELIPQLSLAARFTKRTLDIILSIIGLTVFSPIFIIVYIAIKLEDGGKVIFRQERIGFHGDTFTLYKLRSMTETSESNGKPQLCQKHDHRLTKVGSFLRSHHLDEIPQFWNVLKGDMSFVGPRPERKFFVDQIKAINPDYEKLYLLRPGLFSEATLYNGYTDTMAKMLKRLSMDLHYLYHRSLWLDMKIIYLTAMSIITGKKF